MVEAGSCKQAVGIMHTYTFDALIVDNDVPDFESGSPLSTRSSTRNSKTPCILIATNRARQITIKDFDTETDGYLFKPIKAGKLEEHVRGVLKEVFSKSELQL